jgi:acyl-CoA thioesterase
MGDLDLDTAVEPTGEPGRYRTRFNRDWEIWGPNGGYLASVALRAAGLESRLTRPATFSCLYLGVGNFDDEVEIEVTSIREAKRAQALRVQVGQSGRALLEAHLWVVDQDLAGLEHDVAVMPDVPAADELKSFEEMFPDEPGPRFWKNFNRKPCRWIPPEEWPPPEVHPIVQQWVRFAPTSKFADPWADAARYVVLLDTFQWPAAHGAHALRSAEDPAFIAPNLDLSVRFHRAAPESEWLLIDAHGPIAEGGLMSGESRVWSQDGRLLASAAGHLLCREVPRGTPGSGTAPPPT